jgi:hypothetical protein
VQTEASSGRLTPYRGLLPPAIYDYGRSARSAPTVTCKPVRRPVHLLPPAHSQPAAADVSAEAACALIHKALPRETSRGEVMLVPLSGFELYEIADEVLVAAIFGPPVRR